MYHHAADCNYPPVVPYLLTGTEWLRLHWAWAGRLRAAVELVKLPNLLAILAAAPLLVTGLGSLAGQKRARGAACRYLLCPALFIDAAVWGQYEPLLCLGMVAAVVLLIRNRPGWAGACLGAALAVKLQAFVLIPALSVYAWRRMGAGALLRATASTLGMVLLIALPAVYQGGGDGVWNSYAGAVDHYRELSIHAGNFWQLLLLYRKHVLHLDRALTITDAAPLLGPFSPKSIGLVAFVSYTLLLMLGLWRRPDRSGLILAAALTAMGFYMLPTQVHERYVIPAVALLALLTPTGYRRTFWMLAWVTGANLLIGICAGNQRMSHTITQPVVRLEDGIYLVSAGLNAGVFLWLSIHFLRRAFSRPASAGEAEANAWTEAAPLAST